MIISQTAASRTSRAIVNTENRMWSFDWHLHLTLVHSKGQGQDHARCDCEYLANGDRANNLLLPTNRKSYTDFPLEYLKLVQAHSKGQSQVMDISTANVSKMVTYITTVAIANKYEVAHAISISVFAFELGPF